MRTALMLALSGALCGPRTASPDFASTDAERAEADPADPADPAKASDAALPPDVGASNDRTSTSDASPVADAGRDLPTLGDGVPDATDDHVPVERPRVPEDWNRRILAVQAVVHDRAAAHGVDPDLLNAVIWVESKFNARARGPAGALGLMQVMPRTGRALAKRLERSYRPYDPEFNIDAGAYYLHRMLRRFDGDESLALAAYNRGAGRVLEWVEANEPLPDSTQGYVNRVQTARKWLPAFIAEIEAEADPRELPPVASRLASLARGG